MNIPNESPKIKIPLLSDKVIAKMMVRTNGYDMEEVIWEYKSVNFGLVSTMQLMEIAFRQKEISQEVKEIINDLDIHFRKLQLNRRTTRFHGEEIYKNILEATLTEAYEKGKEFFNNNDGNLWNKKLNEYKTLAIRLFKGDDLQFMLNITDRLHLFLLDLHNDFICDAGKIPTNEAFDFCETANLALDEKDLQKQKQIYIDAIADCELTCLYDDDYSSDEPEIKEFLEKCHKAIEVIDFQIKNSTKFDSTEIGQESEEQIKEPSAVPKDFTTRRQVLAMYYLLDTLDKSTRHIDRSVKARFIEFMTGKNYDSIYKTLSDPLKGLEKDNNQNAIKDMKYVKSHFEELGLKAIAQKIANDMKGTL